VEGMKVGDKARIINSAWGSDSQVEIDWVLPKSSHFDLQGKILKISYDAIDQIKKHFKINDVCLWYASEIEHLHQNCSCPIRDLMIKGCTCGGN
jgi:hypothetical protein